MYFLVEKATELAASELWPLRCARGVARAPGPDRMTRWERLAGAANEQSLAARPMRLGAPLAPHDLILSMPDDTLPLVCRTGAEPLDELERGERDR